MRQRAAEILLRLRESRVERDGGLQLLDPAVHIPGAEQQAARDAIISLAPFMNTAKDDPDLTEGQANDIKQKIEVLQGQLTLVDSLMKDLDANYKKFLTAHPS